MKAQRFTTQRETALDYWVYVPPEYDGETPYPLVMFLHGAGERGNLESVKKHGLPRLFAEGEDLPFIMVAPSCPTVQWWLGLIPELNGLLDEVLANYNIDPNCVYLTGLSMGGNGAWHWAMHNPERFAALIPVCGFGVDILYPPGGMEKLATLPIWAFHGAEDDVVDVSETREIVAALTALGANVRYTEYPGVYHNSWNKAYATPELYEWMLAQYKE